MSQAIKILFIDDQQDFLDTMEYWMKSKGYDVAVASDGEAGIAALKKSPADIVFVDFKMAGMDGMEVVKKIREFNKQVPIVIVTAYAEDALITKTQEYNISGFFSKVSSYEELERVLDIVLRNLKRSKAEGKT